MTPITYAAWRKAHGRGTRCLRAETTRDCPFNHRWFGKEAWHR